MKAMKNLVSKLVKDEQGGEVLEYALIAGLIVVAAIAVIGAVGNKVLARWSGSQNWELIRHFELPPPRGSMGGLMFASFFDSAWPSAKPTLPEPGNFPPL